MEAVGQNATLFPESQISANFISAQALYLCHLEKLVAKVSKVSIVPFSGSRFAIFYYYNNISQVIFKPKGSCRAACLAARRTTDEKLISPPLALRECRPRGREQGGFRSRDPGFGCRVVLRRRRHLCRSVQTTLSVPHHRTRQSQFFTCGQTSFRGRLRPRQ